MLTLWSLILPERCILLNKIMLNFLVLSTFVANERNLMDARASRDTYDKLIIFRDYRVFNLSSEGEKGKV